ncbi:MAG: hypothetical protein ACQEQ4_04380 [Fibrobacterota bacterium]
MKKAVLKLLVCTICSISGITGEEFSDGYGTTAFAFLNKSYSARSRALGTVHSVLSPGKSAFAANAVHLSSFDSRRITSMYGHGLADMQHGSVAYAHPYSEELFLGGMLRLADRGKIDARDEFGNQLDAAFHPFAVSLSALGGYVFAPEFRLGSAVHVGYDNLAGAEYYDGSSVTAWGSFMDVSMLYTPADFLHLSSGFRNAGIILSDYDTEYQSSPPTSLFAGISGSVRNEVLSLWYLEGEYYLHTGLLLKTAVEIELPRYVTLRTGTRFTPHDISRLLSQLSGDRPLKSEYSKNTVDLFSLGGGLDIPVADAALLLDFSLTFNSDNIPPELAFTLGSEF